MNSNQLKHRLAALMTGRAFLLLPLLALLVASAVQTYATTGALVSRFKQTNRFAGANPFTPGSAAISGDTAVLGAPIDVNDDAQRGAAYVYRRTNGVWTQEARLAAPTDVFSSRFGDSVAISGDTIIVGTENNGWTGYNRTAYVFVRTGTTWTQQATLDVDGYNNFYSRVAIDGDTAVVGLEDKGVYIFVRTGATWTLQASPTVPNIGSQGYGSSVAISGNTILVGSHDGNYYPYNDYLGAAYIFVRSGSTWTLQQRLVPSGAGSSDYATGYAFSVALSGDRAFVSASRYTSQNPYRYAQGRVYAFERSGATWTQTQIITAVDAGYGDYFGYSLAATADKLIVGAVNDSIDGKAYQGSAYVFARVGSQWQQKQKLTATDAHATGGLTIYGGFAKSVAISGETVLVDYYAFDKLNVRTVAFDYNDDGKSDIAQYRSSNGAWYVMDSQSVFSYQQFGAAGDKPVPADYDGDGKSDYALYRGGTWIVERSSFGTLSVQFGAASDIPQPADVDGDGLTDFVVFRPSNGAWYVLNAATNQVSGIQFGAGTDKPAINDYDGDGKADFAVVRQADGVSTWYILGTTQGFYGLQFGADTDQVVPADYDGDGKTDIAVWRPSNGVWYLQRSTAGFTGIQYGANADLLAPADYDGDGKTDVGVFRPSNGVWYWLNSTGNQSNSYQFGQSGDKPIPNAFVF